MSVGQTHPAGSVVVVRDEEWVVSSSERAGDGWKVRCAGRTELVRGTTATFFDSLDKIDQLDPAKAELVQDTSPNFRRSRLWVEAVRRKTPVPLHEPGLTVAQHMLLDTNEYQRQAVQKALDPRRLRPRLLIADAVGLGKTLEIGMTLAELQRRGRADRVLVVTPRHVLEQMQFELWTRFAIPLVRLDSEGIAKVRQQLPASRNPFTFFPKVIVSIDTLKSARYRTHLEHHHWDVVVIDEAHNLARSSTLNSQLARTVAPNTEALILASATPHNGDAESFANLVNLLDPTAIVDRSDYDLRDIQSLFIRRHRNSPEVAREVNTTWAARPVPQLLPVVASPAEDALATELSEVWLHPREGAAPVTGQGRHLFPWTLAKAFLSSPAALLETVQNRQKTLADKGESHTAEGSALARLAELAEVAEGQGSAKLDALLTHLRSIGIRRGSDIRVVLFTERLATLHWLRRTLPAALKLPDEAFAVLHGAMQDTEQLEVVDAFGRSGSPIRVLLTGDVASEGVNLHKQCHHLVHVDIPWSLIRIEQRNGRIDRYGQVHPPQITALALTTSDERFSGDVRVITRLLDKEHAAHTALGDAASLLDLHDVDREEAAIRKALAEGLDLDEVVPEPAQLTPAVSGLAVLEFLNSAAAATPPTVPEWEERGLFASEVDFLREALHEAFKAPAASPEAGGVGWREHDDEGVAELVPPADLMTRLTALPQSYLSERKVRDRLLLATTRTAAEESLRLARAGETTQWPTAHYLSPLHPVLDWAVDRALSQLGRNHVPVALADVQVPTAITLGTLSNHRGQVVLRSIVAQEFHDGAAEPMVVEDVATLLDDSGFTRASANTGAEIDLLRHQPLVPAAVSQMRRWMQTLHDLRVAAVVEPIEQAKERIEGWSEQAEALASTRTPAQATKSRRDIERIRRDANQLAESLAARPDPMVRVLLLLLPRKEGQ
ncbi:helicase-related protein [Modestobacter sp. VKM Ac-2983]|uniref:SNF2-related protein n=1 Tax=Modestobacter sp. VKM Ac-2983 TaxID=3004137 RepID=UPI0022AB9B2F|nr:SNF2-related protein [Modestobacter sp. VKM Ac-2983]MCZ2804840.1 helicase-related protein [Modestobacter sp. VKM Ac-2983]